MHLLPFMESQEMPRTTRIDAVWDCYHKHSLKNQTRTKRQAGGGIQGTWVSTKKPIPRGKDWQQFLPINHNKDVLFKYLCASDIYPLNLSALQPTIQHVVCVLARQTTRRLTAGWCCIFSMVSWLVIRWRLSVLLTQMLWYCQSTIIPHSKT